MDRDINPFFDQIRRPVEIQQFHGSAGIAIKKLPHSGHDVKASQSRQDHRPNEAFRSVDHDLPLSFARQAHQAGTQNFALVSAIGASVDSSFFYARVKGELERDVREIGFRSLAILRPSIIEGGRDEVRLAETLVLKLSHFLAPVLPKRFHLNPAPKIAQVLVDAVVTAEPGCHFRYSDSLV